jgi:hypothetical protein
MLQNSVWSITNPCLLLTQPQTTSNLKPRTAVPQIYKSAPDGSIDLELTPSSPLSSPQSLEPLLLSLLNLTNGRADWIRHVLMPLALGGGDKWLGMIPGSCACMGLSCQLRRG